MKQNEIIVEYRNKKNLTQAEVALKADINLKYYQSIERGEREQHLTTLLKIANALNIPFDFLLKDIDKNFLIYSILDCFEQYSDHELLALYKIIGSYLYEE